MTKYRITITETLSVEAETEVEARKMFEEGKAMPEEGSVVVTEDEWKAPRLNPHKG